MAGNKMSTKSKGKEERSKASKAINNSNDDTEDNDIDFALLRKPILTSITGFAQARKIFDVATEELKDLLSNECDLLYECKVCRNIFRSVANFISHKRVYCQEKFNSTIHSHFFKSSSTVNEMLKIKRVEEGYQEYLKEKNELDYMSVKDDERVPLTKDLTTIVESIAEIKGMSENTTENQHVILQKIPNSSVAVFQNININEDDNMRSQVMELDRISSKDNAILQNDGNFKVISKFMVNESDNVIQISDDDDNEGRDVLKCKICDHRFSTQKTLKFHMKYKHLESRLVYPCPDCLDIFSTSWSVYRHLFKVHRKTAAQIRRLRESIQAKAFRMNNPPAFYEKRKNNMKPTVVQKITEEERLDQENQAWMDNMEGDGELPRCGGCGRTFERRAALSAHTHTCQPRSRALARRAHSENKKIEIQIRKDYNKGPSLHLNLTTKASDNNENKSSNEETHSVHKSQKENQKNAISEESKINCENNAIDDNLKSKEVTETATQSDICKLPILKLRFAQQTEMNNLMVFKQKIQPDIELNGLICKRCDIKLNNIEELYDHMAGHYNWMRYACKLCNFKHYHFEKLPEHVKIVHKLKGDTDFYFSTVKAIDGNEALELAESMEETNDAEETSPDSRYPSRCSSDSSRLSDDSSSSSTRLESMMRKRKMYQNKNNAKRKKYSPSKVESEEIKDGDASIDKVNTALGENESPSSIKGFEENSSDIDDVEEKLSKRQVTEDFTSVALRRPVRKRTRPKNEDFEYDLSNLLKMEAQGYRDSQSNLNSKSNQSKKKVQQDNQNNYDSINKEHAGALATLTKKAVDIANAHMKVCSFSVYNSSKDQRTTNIFIRPMIPKTFLKGDKVSPNKEVIEVKDDLKDDTINSRSSKTPDIACDLNKALIVFNNSVDESAKNNEKEESTVQKTAIESSNNKDQKCSGSAICGTVKTSLNIPAVVPIKFRRQSLEIIKNPLINKNITDFKKAGMKTKILLIKPIDRKKDGTQVVNSPLKFQTIKLKEPNKSSTSEDKTSDRVVVVKVPKVDCAISRTVPDTNNISHELTEQNNKTNSDNDVSEKAVKTNENNETNTEIKSDTSINNENIKEEIGTDKDETHSNGTKTVTINSEIVSNTEESSNDMHVTSNNVTNK